MGEVNILPSERITKVLISECADAQADLCLSCSLATNSGFLATRPIINMYGAYPKVGVSFSGI